MKGSHRTAPILARNSLFLSLTLALAPALTPTVAAASGFAIREQSATALGNAFAGGAAGAEDASYSFFNPAALARLDGHQVVAVGNFIRPMITLDVDGATTAGGSAISGGDGGGDVAEDHLLPAFYAVLDLEPYVDVVDNFRLGLGVTVPFGLETDYEPGWAGRYYALQSKLQTVNFTPSLAFDLFDGLSVGAGLQAQYLSAELSNAIDFGSLGAATPGLAPFARPTEQDGRARVDGSDWAFGWTAGLLAEPWAGTRLGIGYRSHLRHQLDGRARFRLDGDGIGQAISTATGAFVDTGAQARMETPETVTLGLHHAFDEEWAVTADAAWTGWSRYKVLRVKFDNARQPDDVVDTDWNDTWFFAAGVTYRPAPPWAIRLGVAYDQSPVPDRTRTPRIPDNDRYWFTAGISYKPTAAIDLAVGYARLEGPDAPLDLSAGQPGNAARGNLSGNADASVDILSVQFRCAF